MSFFVMESSTTDNYISGPGEVDQPQPIRGCFVEEAEFSDSWAEDTFFAHPDVEDAKQNFDILAGAALISMLEALVKSILGHTSFTSIGESNQRYVKKFPFDADCGRTFINWSDG